MKAQEQGLTLVEFMLAMLLLLTALSMASQVILTGQAGARQFLQKAEKNDPLWTVFSLLSEDIAFAVADFVPAPLGDDPDQTGWCCSVSPDGLELNFAVYQYRVALGQGGKPQGWDQEWLNQGWPGWLGELYALRLTYRLEPEGAHFRLIREVADGGTGVIYSHQLIATELDQDESRFSQDSGQAVVKATFRGAGERAGVKTGALMHGAWHVR